MPLGTFAVAATAGAVAGAVAASAYFSIEQGRRAGDQILDKTSHVEATSSARSNTRSRDNVTPSVPVPPVEPRRIFDYGFLGPVAELRSTPSLVSSFDRRMRNPHWVAEHITPQSLASQDGNRKHSVFLEDTTVPAMFRAKLSDYSHSGFDRGHQVPAADAKWSQDAMNSTFVLNNICPQVGDGFNRDYWAHLEDFCRRLTTSYPSVRIITGPLYLPRRDADGKWRVQYEMIGSPPNVAVPTHFFKVIFAEDGRKDGNVSIGAFVLPNAEIANNEPLEKFEVPIEIVEKGSGLEFAKALPLEKRRRLCEEVRCSIIVKDYQERQRTFKKL